MKILKRMRSMASNRKVTKKTKCGVCFNKAVEVKEIEVIQNGEDVWYGSRDYERMQMVNKLLIRKMMGHPDAQNVSLGEESTRGLAWQHPQLRRQRESLRRQSCMAVFHEQEIQMMRNEDNGEKIAEVYRTVSEPQIDLALRQAAKDEKFVREYACAA